MCEPIVPAYSKASRAVQRDTRDDGKAQEEIQIKGKAGKVGGEGRDEGVELGYIQAPGSLLLSSCTREAEVHLYRRQSVSQQRQTDRQQRINGTGGSPWQVGFPSLVSFHLLWEVGSRRRQASFPRWSVWCILYIPWFWTWGLPPATGRAPEEVDRHGAMLAWSSASGATLCDPIMRPGRGRAGSVVVLAGKGGMDDNVEGQAAAGGRGSMSGRDLGEPRDGFVKGRGQ